MSVDETGDYVEWLRHPCELIYAEKYGTVFDVRRSAPYEPPQVDFTYGRNAVPPQPQPVSTGPTSLIGSWIGYLTSQSLTGDQIDTLREPSPPTSKSCIILTIDIVGGPDRPLPTLKSQRPAASSTGDSTSGGRPQPNRSNSVADMANSASRGVSDLYSRLNNALAERGCVLLFSINLP